MIAVPLIIYGSHQTRLINFIKINNCSVVNFTVSHIFPTNNVYDNQYLDTIYFLMML